MAKEYAYHYSICTNQNDELFVKQCEAIEKHIPKLTKDELFEDIDGSSYQIYHHANGDIEVSNDYYVGALYVESDFDLLPYFPQKNCRYAGNGSKEER